MKEVSEQFRIESDKQNDSKSMITIVRAVYENQVLRLETPLPVTEGEVIEVTLKLPDSSIKPQKRFSWEEGPVLSEDSYAGDVADEIRRQRDSLTVKP